MSDADLSKKFRDQAADVLTETRSARLLSLCWNVDTLTDVGEIARNSVKIRGTPDPA
jgi:hypothetical protein